jgi:Glycosyltransferase Family 4
VGADLNVLLITFGFPPAGGVGVLRALSLAKYLPETGIRMDVLCARNAPAVGKDPTLLQQVPTRVTVHRCWTLDLPFAVRKAMKKAMSGKGVPQQASIAVPGKASVVQRFKRFVGNLLLPDPQVGWLPFAFPAARRIIRQRKIDLVLVTVPPFSTARLVGKLREAFPALPIVLDFRDEWLTTTIELVMFNKNDRARTVAQHDEAIAVRAASAVVMVTEAALREIRGRYPDVDQTKFFCVPNGYDTIASHNQVNARTTGMTVLTYLGSVYGSTDPMKFVEAVRGLPGDVRRRLKIRFIGRIETDAYRNALLSLGDTVELRGFIPQAEALRAIDDTTYLLLITRDHINVSAKFYDYLGGGKPILAAVQPDGDVRHLLEETKAGWWADGGNVAAIQLMLVEAVERQERLLEEFRPDTERIAAYHRRPLAQRYATILQDIVKGRPA